MEGLHKREGPSATKQTVNVKYLGKKKPIEPAHAEGARQVLRTKQ